MTIWQLVLVWFVFYIFALVRIWVNTYRLHRIEHKISNIEGMLISGTLCKDCKFRLMYETIAKPKTSN